MPAPFIDPSVVLGGTLLVAAPHMDDGVLGCGGAVSSLSQKNRIHFVYATDGAKSPVPSFPWQGKPSASLPLIRRLEAETALKTLRVPAENIHFLGYPDGSLSRHFLPLRRSLIELLDRLQPAHLLIPFRYDRHPDHLALNRAAMSALAANDAVTPEVREYFIYHRWRLLPGGDIRSLVRKELLEKVATRESASLKMAALLAFTSQTTVFFAWQDRPILTRKSLEEACAGPEIFLRHDPAYPGATIFKKWRLWIRAVHSLEPRLKKTKDLAVALFSRKDNRRGTGLD